MVQRAILDTRLAVRRALATLWGAEQSATAPKQLALVALSGGADSLALAAAVAAEARRQGAQAGAVVVDHGLQAGSVAIAERAADAARALGLEPVTVVRVEVESQQDGPEAAARTARYDAFKKAAEEHDAAAVLTAHTRDDQAEQVLLALGRGSGTRSVAGIPQRRRMGDERWLIRPFLIERPEITRRTTEQACAEAGLDPWHDPHNSDPTFTRVRVRERIIPVLTRELGVGIARGLARSADLAREDADALDALAQSIVGRAIDAGAANREVSEVAVAIDVLAEQPAALRNRVIRMIASEVFAAHWERDHVLAVAELVTGWRGQGPIYAPGVRVTRAEGMLLFAVQAGSPRSSPDGHDPAVQ